MSAGTFGGADAMIGRVPLQLSERRGRAISAGALTVDGSLTVSDLAELPRFYPLRSNDLHFRLADDMIRATGSLRHPASGTKVTDVTITIACRPATAKRSSTCPGSASAHGLQPEELTRLTEGVIALVNGTVAGQGRIDWRGTARSPRPANSPPTTWTWRRRSAR